MQHEFHVEPYSMHKVYSLHDGSNGRRCRRPSNICGAKSGGWGWSSLQCKQVCLLCIECQKLSFLRNKSWDGGLGMSSEIEYTVTVCSALVQPGLWVFTAGGQCSLILNMYSWSPC